MRRLPLLLVPLALQALACSGHYAHTMRETHDLAKGGEPALAYEELQRKTKDKDWDPLLVALDEGALLHRAGRWEASATALNRAIALADERETVRLSEELLGSAPFRLAGHEKQALHALQALNYLQLGRLDDAAVEARRTDLRQAKLSREADQSRKDERFMLGTTLDETQRTFFEQLSFARFVSGLSRELDGDLDGAFIDYHRGWQLAREAPADAQVGTRLLAANAVRVGTKLGRSEVESLSGQLGPDVDAVPLGADGQLVVFVEAGFVPAVVLDEGQRAHRTVPVPRSTAPGYLVVDGVPVVPEPVASLEELSLRRGYRGQILDRERAASIGVNTGLFVSYFVLFPITGPLIIRRAYESTIRSGQSWMTLPRELQVAQVRLRPGRHRIRLPTFQGFEEREVEIFSGRQTVVVAQAP